MSVRDKRNRNKNTFIRTQIKQNMIRNLQDGKTYGTNFFHKTKAELNDTKHHKSRYK